MKYIAIIPARGGSKGIPQKNLTNLLGKPLIAWTIQQALATPSIDMVVVSTDCPHIADVARSYGANVPFLRPSNLAQDRTPTEPVLMHALDWYAEQGQLFDALLLLQPTSPLRYEGQIERAIHKFEEDQADSLLSVCESHAFFWSQLDAPIALYDYINRPRRQDIEPKDHKYKETGSIYVTRTDSFRVHKNRLCGKISLFLMEEDESWEIDSLTDLKVISTLMEANYKL